MTRLIQISTTVDTRRKAKEIANTLAMKRLVACVQILGPIQSVYRWNGKIEHSKEWLCLVKAREEDYGSIETTIKRMHPREVPEILAVPVLRRNRDYLNWVRKETTRRPNS